MNATLNDTVTFDYGFLRVYSTEWWLTVYVAFGGTAAGIDGTGSLQAEFVLGRDLQEAEPQLVRIAEQVVHLLAGQRFAQRH